jgi:UDP-N-acetylglucosamine 2-epimerase (non-hydrolysing)
MKIVSVVGARPNFMKIALLSRAIERYNNSDRSDYPSIHHILVHTGQHYDEVMSDSFFRDLEIPAPDIHLGAGSGSHAKQTGRIMVAFEKVCGEEKPDWVVVVGDVNSTLACAIVAKKAGIRVAHVEAGLRSRDMTMPEEINRIVTDSISDLFFVTEQSGVDNLLAEGKPAEQVRLVGHVMVDNLLHQLRRLEGEGGRRFASARFKPAPKTYAFLTLHRPANVDDPQAFTGIAEALNSIAESHQILFPVHPRTRARIDAFGIRLYERIVQLPPLGFQEALYLWKDAAVVLTDSGGLQEETTALGIPCLTLRENTERPVTIEQGTNILAGTTMESILSAWKEFSRNGGKAGRVPELWDGRAAERILDALLEFDESRG